MFILVLYIIVEKWESFIGLFINGQISKMGYVSTGEYYLKVKRIDYGYMLLDG